jgi:ferredoxin
MLVINPIECIDCGVCEPECPADAIRPDTAPDMQKWVEFNQKYSEIWPNITVMRPEDTPADADDWHGVAGKIQYFSEAPGKGD